MPLYSNAPPFRGMSSRSRAQRRGGTLRQPRPPARNGNVPATGSANATRNTAPASPALPPPRPPASVPRIPAKQVRPRCDDYQHALGTILTEDDLKCLLGGRFLEILDLRRSQLTADNQTRGTMVDAEVSWFDRNRQLRIKPDITILGRQALGLFHPLDWGEPRFPPPSQRIRFRRQFNHL